MYVLGLDPSFIGFGVAKIDIISRTVSTKKFSVEIDKKRFDYISEAAISLLQNVDDSYNLTKSSCTVMETPPPNSQFSAGLWSLDTLLFTLTKDTKRYCVGPNYIGFLHGVRKWKKSQSVALAKDLVEIFKNKGYDVTGFKAESNQSEAFLMCVRAFIRYVDYLEENSIEAPLEIYDIRKYICDKYPKYLDRKEFYLSY